MKRLIDVNRQPRTSLGDGLHGAMYELLATTHPGASDAAFELTARDLGRDLPAALRRLLERSNGGDLRPEAVLRVPDGSTAGALTVLPVEQIAPVTRTLLGQGADAVWARDGNGNALTIDDAGFVRHR